MTTEDHSYKDKKVISIGIVSELTGLSVRQIRYYEERKLIYPQRSSRGDKKILLCRCGAADGYRQ